MTPAPSTRERVSTGVAGLDQILRGGLPKDMLYMAHGAPGTGKTTLGFQFLLDGVRCGERVLYASLLQTRAELESILASHGWSLDGVDLLDLPEEVRDAATEGQTLFSTKDVELREVNEAITEAIQRYKPQRLLFDSVTELGVLVDNPYQLRRQLLKLKQLLDGLGCTTLMTVSEIEGLDLTSVQTVVHGVVRLASEQPCYGRPHRWLEVLKVRGMPYHAGRHDFRIVTGGLKVYPRLEIPDNHRKSEWSLVTSGNDELDALLGGGLEQGTACLLTGTTGSGKSTLASLYARAAGRRGQRAVIFCFDERRQTFLRRADALELGIEELIDEGLIDLRQVNVGEISPGEFADTVARAADDGAKAVVIDSIGGYLNAMPGQRMLLIQLHEILSYLGSAGVLTLMVNATHGIGLPRESDIDASYIVDTVVLMRSFEAAGEVRRCISVLKKRHGRHEKTIREMQIEKGGINVGPPLKNFQNVLTGAPTFLGKTEDLLNGNE